MMLSLWGSKLWYSTSILDPANETQPTTPAIDVTELVNVSDVMENMKLGPNGALVYSMDFLLTNFDWLQRKLLRYPDHYFLFDCPGQIELYTHHGAMKDILERLAKLNFRLCVVQLVDSHYCSDAGKYIATLLMALSSMLMLGMPHINVLSKIDLARRHSDKLPFNLEFYTEVFSLKYLLEALDEDKFTKKYVKLNAAIVELVEDFSLVSFLPLSVANRKSLLRVRAAADRANGYVFGAGEERNVQALLACAVGAEFNEDPAAGIEGTRQEDTNCSDDLLWK